MKPPYDIRQFVYPDDYPAMLSVWEAAGPGLHIVGTVIGGLPNKI